LGRRRSAKPAEFPIDNAPDRPLDVTAADPDIAERTIVQLPQRFDGFPANPMGGEVIHPTFDPTDKSAGRVGGRALRGSRGHRGHFFFSGWLSRHKAMPLAQTLTDSGCTICDVGLLAPQCNRWVDMT
jgi:hypothetical protein